MDAAVDRGISNLVIGKSISPWWLKLFKKNLAQQLLNQENSIALTILHPEQGTKRLISSKTFIFIIKRKCFCFSCYMRKYFYSSLRRSSIWY